VVIVLRLHQGQSISVLFAASLRLAIWERQAASSDVTPSSRSIQALRLIFLSRPFDVSASVRVVDLDLFQPFLLI
jgi:hypothetical protein